jgi:hypothetical protein
MPVREIESFPHQKLLQCMRNAANYMTQLPYFKGIEKINSNFTRIDSIIHVGNDDICVPFLKCKLSAVELLIPIFSVARTRLAGSQAHFY